MAVFVPWPRRRSSIFDLGHIGGLSPNRTIPLLVSPQVLYALQNVALVEIADPNRYAIELVDDGYNRVQPGDEAEYAQFLEIVSQTGLQLSDHLIMSTPVNYREALFVQTSDVDADAGVNHLSIQGPGEDEVWVIDHVSAWNDTSGNTTTIIYVVLGSNSQLVAIQVAAPADQKLVKQGPIHLSNDFSIKATFINCTAGDDIYLQISGYVMELVA